MVWGARLVYVEIRGEGRLSVCLVLYFLLFHFLVLFYVIVFYFVLFYLH